MGSAEVVDLADDLTQDEASGKGRGWLADDGPRLVDDCI